MRALCGVPGQVRAYRTNLAIGNGYAVSGPSRGAQSGSRASAARLGVRDGARLKPMSTNTTRTRGICDTTGQSSIGRSEAERTLGERR